VSAAILGPLMVG